MPNADEARRALANVRAGGKRAMAHALAAIEKQAGTAETAALLDAAWSEQRGQALGMTGPPGVGKSTLTDKIVQSWRAVGQTVGVLAVDPSSAATGGALLGDRTRFALDPEDQGLFVRSLAARGTLGGLSALVFPALVLMRAVYDRVLIESVGVGQSETEIAAVADTVLLCIQPAAGDALQFMKAGVTEIPHIAVVTKADLGPPAARARAEVDSALKLSAGAEPGWETVVLAVSATTGQGFEHLLEAYERRSAWLDEQNRLAKRRASQSRNWQARAVAEKFGSEGLEKAWNLVSAAGPDTPFSAAHGAIGRISVHLSPETQPPSSP